MFRTFTAQEQAVLRIVQNQLPDSAEPFAEIATQTGLQEAEVLTLLNELTADGTIRRFGATLRHYKTEWQSNAMVAWKADREMAEKAGKRLSCFSRISHCYYRPSPYPDWPYTLYTMIHGHSDEECQHVVQQIIAETNLREYSILDTIQELKKISMTYFS